MSTIGHLFSCRHGAYSVVVACETAEQARATFQHFLSERGVNAPVHSIAFPRSTRSIGERTLLLPGKLNGAYAVTVSPDISDEPVRYLFVNETDADRFVEEVEPEGVVSYEPIAWDWDDSDLQGYAHDLTK